MPPARSPRNMSRDPTDPANERKRTPKERMAEAAYNAALRQLQRDREEVLLRLDTVPAEWFMLDERAPVRPKRKRVTLLMDADALAWYRSLGDGYQGRINAVLRAYMLGVVSKAIDVPGSRDKAGVLI